MRVAVVVSSAIPSFPFSSVSGDCNIRVGVSDETHLVRTASQSGRVCSDDQGNTVYLLDVLKLLCGYFTNPE